MSDLKSADEIIEEYSKPHSMIDNGNLYFACCTYQTEYKKIQSELAQIKEKCSEYRMVLETIKANLPASLVGKERLNHAEMYVEHLAMLKRWNEHYWMVLGALDK